MRIVRPGSVVGPQQQYMYLKQLEWVKWAAMDEVKKQEAEAKLRTTPVPTVPQKLVTPATPPAEGDDITMQTTPPLPVLPLPPVTPSRHVATATAKANDIAPPGQPRKTPATKRAARDSDDEDESADTLPELGVAPPARKMKTVSASRGGAPTSAPPNTRVMRSSTVKNSAMVVPPESPVKPTRQGPNKIPRLASTRTAAASRALAQAGSEETIATRTRSQRNPPPPSRLPTLAHKRTQSSSLSDVANIKKSSQQSDAWVANNAAAVVAPASKSQRPGLRSIRRRRSSFSSADIVA